MGTSEPDLGVGRLGILGGTFNPPHIGHLRCARQALDQLALDRVVLMPVNIPPHKRNEQDPGPEHRLAMCSLAAQSTEGITVSDLELRRAGPSYTVETLRALHDAHAETELTFILGADVARSFAQWREPLEVLSLARLAVAEREGTARQELTRVLTGLGAGARVVFLDMAPVDLSSSGVRARAAAGEPIIDLVPDGVAAYIAAHDLYGVRAWVGGPGVRPG